MTRSILLVDDEPAVVRLLAHHFGRGGWDVCQALSGEDALRAYESRRPDVVLLDLNLPGISGLDVLDVLAPRGAAVVMVTGDAEVPSAVAAMERGAVTYLTKPLDLQQVESSAERAAARAALRRAADAHDASDSRDPWSALGTSPRMRGLARDARLVAAARDTSVLLLGESGTGKSLVARMIHRFSPRARGPMVEVNCAGLSATFLDTELFGHERGAFTDAKEMKRGLFEVANGGTLFLDEIGDLDPALQPKLLRVLETQSFRRLGATRETSVDVRLVAATSRDLPTEVKAGRFRADLYYRLAVCPITIPALRDRSRDDVVQLIRAAVSDLRVRHPESPARVSPRALELLVSYAWPGNVRELRNALEHALVLARGAEVLQPEHLPAAVTAPGLPRSNRQEWEVVTLDEIERRHIERTLFLTAGNRTLAAEKLGISRATLHAKIKEYGLQTVGRDVVH